MAVAAEASLETFLVAPTTAKHKIEVSNPDIRKISVLWLLLIKLSKKLSFSLIIMIEHNECGYDCWYNLKNNAPSVRISKN